MQNKFSKVENLFLTFRWNIVEDGRKTFELQLNFWARLKLSRKLCGAYSRFVTVQLRYRNAQLLCHLRSCRDLRGDFPVFISADILL